MYTQGKTEHFRDLLGLNQREELSVVQESLVTGVPKPTEREIEEAENAERLERV